MNLAKVRVLFGVLVAAFLFLCYAAYLFAYSQGRQVQFAAQMDQPPIQILSLLLLVGIVALAAIKTDSEEGSP